MSRSLEKLASELRLETSSSESASAEVGSSIPCSIFLVFSPFARLNPCCPNLNTCCGAFLSSLGMKKHTRWPLAVQMAPQPFGTGVLSKVGLLTSTIAAVSSSESLPVSLSDMEEIPPLLSLSLASSYGIENGSSVRKSSSCSMSKLTFSPSKNRRQGSRQNFRSEQYLLAISSRRASISLLFSSVSSCVSSIENLGIPLGDGYSLGKSISTRININSSFHGPFKDITKLPVDTLILSNLTLGNLWPTFPTSSAKLAGCVLSPTWTSICWIADWPIRIPEIQLRWLNWSFRNVKLFLLEMRLVFLRRRMIRLFSEVTGGSRR
ncbi:hypothetical protein OGATHE_000226 [Ogataea polymorpha]|uniref:Uncharacterized protein n=1 Tax=Ogataea polymorpha TaxID=460523 RepID=A0A9P8TH52_9ASCO|nr:hypothetical protein OGATHE_000226 [Ogataea polymorpha]